MNILCMGGRIVGVDKAIELANAFLKAEFSNAERHKRRLGKIEDCECQS
jgi:ribose 5-phosphate isomerase B